MDLGIRGRSAIVCASSQGLGKGCALALAAFPAQAQEAPGVETVVDSAQRDQAVAVPLPFRR